MPDRQDTQPRFEEPLAPAQRISHTKKKHRKKPQKHQAASRQGAQTRVATYDLTLLAVSSLLNSAYPKQL